MAQQEARITQPESYISPSSEYGLLRSAAADRSVWLYARIPPTAPLLDGANDQKRQQNTNQIMAFFDGLAQLVGTGAMKYRDMLRGSYREFQILGTAMPVPFRCPPAMRNTDLGRWQNEAYRESRYNVQKQNCFAGVKLLPGGNFAGNKKRTNIVEKALTAIDHTAYSIANGVPKFDEYLPDTHRIEKIMLNAGFEPFSLMMDDERERYVSELRSWWVARGSSNALPVIAESSHIHLFPDIESCEAAKKMWDDGVECEDWNIVGEYPATVCFAKSSTFAQNPTSRAASQWIARLLEVDRAGGANAVGVSIRGKVEPGSVTADQIRRNKNTIEEAIKDREKHNRLPTGEMTDIHDRLEYKQAIYRQPDMPPTLIDLSIGVLAAGTAQDALDSLAVVPQIDFVNMNTAKEQLFGFKSMQACSPVRVTPYELHWSSTTVAGGGVNSFSKAGDKTGAMLGESEANRQPVFIGTTTVQDEDRAPMLAIIGGTGSGKAIYNFSTIPVPPQYHFPAGAFTTISKLQEGDLVYGRDGKPYPILKLHPIHTEDLYEVILSDGQKIKVSGDHQWVVSNRRDRIRQNTDKHKASIARWNRLKATERTLQDIAAPYKLGTRLSCAELAPLVKDVMSEWWSTDKKLEHRLSDIMRFMEVPVKKEMRTTIQGDGSRLYVKKQNCPRYDPQELLNRLIERFEYNSTHAPRWREENAEKARILRTHLSDEFDRGLSITDIQNMLDTDTLKRPTKSTLQSLIASFHLDTVSDYDYYETTRKAVENNRETNTYEIHDALQALANRLLLMYGDSGPNTSYDEQVVTTREMITQGLETRTSGSNWAIHVPDPVQGPQVDLEIDPWLLGAWLADGDSRSGAITGDGSNGDLEYVKKRAESLGYETNDYVCGRTVGIHGLFSQLSNLGLINNKHIPLRYFFASEEQRLELVRGLLDQDGTISPNGSIEFTQSVDHEPIIRGLIHLLRSLGIVVNEPRQSEAYYRKEDGDRIKAQDRLRITFTTDKKVFSLPRKRRQLPSETRDTQNWLYVRDIRKIPDAPHRCLTVGSPDHTFLVGDYVPTHNTMCLLNLMFQWSQIDCRDGKGKTPCVLIDPKENSDFSEPVLARGGKVFSMDSDFADGIFDPFNVLQSAEEAKEMATIMLANIFSPGGQDTTLELTVSSMITYGLKLGAKRTGTCIEAAYQAYMRAKQTGKHIEGLDEHVEKVHEQVMTQVRNNQFFRIIIGTNEDTQPLKVSNALTLIKAGARSLVPAEGSEKTMTGRIQRWVLRMTVLGAGTAVRGRDGMVGLDEAWVALGEGSGMVVQQWTRLARSQRFTPVLASQKVQEFIDAGLAGGISRAILLSLEDPEESNGTVSPAKAALRLMSIDDSDGMILSRMPIRPEKDNGSPNWSSLQRLRVKDPETHKTRTIRGSVAYFKDGSNLPVPVEITIPDKLLREISTTATDVLARQKAEAQNRKQQQARSQKRPVQRKA